MDINQTDVDLSGYPEHAQLYIKKLTEDPGSVPTRHISEIAHLIMARSYKSPDYYHTAATICSYVIEVEYQQQAVFSLPKYSFRVSLIDECQVVLEEWQKIRNTDIQCWISYCKFIGEMYRRVCAERTIPITSFGQMMARILIILTKQPCIENFEEVDLLCSLFHDHGSSMKRTSPKDMEDIMNAIRDAFLSDTIDLSTQRLLQPLIEMYASDFNLNKEAVKLYFQM